jgi:hypothetical protein
MDARITAEAAQMSLVASPKVKVVVTTKVDDLVRALVSLFDPAVILAPFLAMGGTSVSAIAPTLFHEREVDALAFTA